MKFYGSPHTPTRRNFVNSATVGGRGSSGFSMASTSRLFEDRQSTTITNDSLLAQQLVRMRNRSRGFARDEDYMKALLGAGRRNVIGPCGINLQMDVRDPAAPVVNPDTGVVEWIAEPDDMANDAIESWWDDISKAWSMTADGRIVPHYTTSGKFGRVQFSQLGITTAMRDGEFFYRLVRGFDNPFGFAVQPINPDFIDELKNEVLPNGDEIRMGVQKNKWGQVTHYWLRTWNPGDTYWAGRGQGSYISQPVPSSDIRHFYVPDDFDLSRGYPWIHAGATRLKMLAGYEEAAIEAARSAACKHEYLEQVLDPNAPTPEYTGDATDASGAPLSDIEPGTRELLPRGIKVTAIDPAYPHSEHKPFVVSVLSGVACGLELSYATLTGDLSQVNYSSMRAGLLPERDMWSVIQALWIEQVELPIFLEALRMSLLKGAIKLANGSALPARNFEKFAKPMFQGRRWPWVDPSKDQDANTTALAQRTTSRIEIIAQQGGDLDDTFRNIARVQKLAKKHGITLPEDIEAQAAMMLAKTPEALPADDQPAPAKKKPAA